MQTGQRVFIVLLILSFVLWTFILITMIGSTLVEHTNRYFTGVAWLDVCSITQQDLLAFAASANTHKLM
jgi:hypothetical protein